MEIGKKYQVTTSKPRRHKFIGVLKDYTYDIHGSIEGHIFQLDYGQIYITKSTFINAKKVKF